MNNILAIVDSKNESLMKEIGIELKKYAIDLYTTTDILQGMDIYIYKMPCIIILDHNNKGFAIAKVLSDKKGKKEKEIIVYMLIEDSIEQKYADFNIDFFIKKPIDIKLLKIQILSYIKKHTAVNFTSELQRAEDNQLLLLPDPVNNEKLSINYLYSPYKILSGDYLKLFTIDNSYYGIVFDCAGHDLLAWQQTGIVETSFRYAIRFYKEGIYKSLSEIMEEVNKNLVVQDMFVAALVFKIDLDNKNLFYVSAGLPNFFIKNSDIDRYKEISLQSKVLGYDVDTKYEEKKLDLNNVDSLIFGSDGLSDMILSSDKNDDVSALFIHINNKRSKDI